MASKGFNPIDPSKLTVSLVSKENLKPIPDPSEMIFGQGGHTDHMLSITFDPSTGGWSAPEIKPYQGITLDPSASVFHYAPAVFEGMKAFRTADGEVRLFRPEMNMRRMERSAARVALPEFDGDALLECIKKLVKVDERWIPRLKGYSMYIRPTYIGTRPAIGVTASTHGMIFVILSPSGPYFPTGFKPITLYANSSDVRAWPGGTGEFKLALNYAPCFGPQRDAARRGYQQVLWLLDEKVTEVGQMNFFVVVRRDDGEVDLITPNLDGTILPGITRDSVLSLARAHTSNRSSSSSLGAHIPKIHTSERSFTISDIISWLSSNRLLEAFGTGTASILCPVSKIGYKDSELVLPTYAEGVGPISKALWERIVEIQEGRKDWKGWSQIV